MNKILYTFACQCINSEECEYIPYYIPADEKDTKGYFEAMTGERVYAYWRIKNETGRN